MELMTIDEMRQHDWFVSWSGGKDSTATIILMHENKIPIKKIIYIRMMWDETIPATMPEINSFVDRTSEVFRSWGYPVDIIPSMRTAVSQMERVFHKSHEPDKNGKKYGLYAFLRRRCTMTSRKTDTIKKNTPKDGFHMIGYWADELDRIHRLGGERQSIMVTMGITEAETFDICRKYNMLSPLYELGLARDGCWFCPNAAKAERQYVREVHPHLFELITKTIEDFEHPLPRLFPLNNYVQDYMKEQLEKQQMTFDEYLERMEDDSI